MIQTYHLLDGGQITAASPEEFVRHVGGKVPLPSFRAACYVPNGNLPGAARSPRKYRSRGGTYRKRSLQR